ncbi:TrkA C-terminal domain-containing protein [Paraburkholderia sp.]|uniref:aspartate:alanine exchanger family transporter n=1 Tax=Paraburkholderia sp. TaxID=1926495 RepID=UPI002385CFC2|nr:TrkA C-terminal domain-containing protein [Paraburkholderia sp.]MDE1179403.1 TrkA C-terminal domain-containing protein [Paraburkholderia sp.]
MQFLRTLLEQQPLMALFLTIGVGYLVGEINIKGFSLGVGAVLFVALASGWFAPKSVPPATIGTLGLALFLYAVGIQYGAQFFLGLTSSQGRRANLLALIGVVLSGLATLAIVRFTDVKSGYALGLFSGSGTSTASLQAAITTLGNDDPAVGYSISYPFGVAGPILLIYLGQLIFKPRINVQASSGLEVLEIALRNPETYGKTLAQVMGGLPSDVQLVAVRTAHHNAPASPDTVLAENDVVLAVAPDRETLERTRQMLGEAAPGRVVRDRADLDYVRVFASRPAVVGRTLGDLDLPCTKASIIAQVRRGDTDVMPRPDLVLEFGDRIGILANRADFPSLRTFFGDSIKGTAEFSYISVGLGMALGFLVGAIQLPMPGLGRLSLGLSGVLIVALILGKVRRTAGINWTIPLSANLVIRNLGLTLFLAQVGMASGPKFAATVSQTGAQMLLLGALVLIALALPILLLGLLVFRMSYDDLAGIIAGACGNPAILAYANKIAPTDRPDVGYAMIFPAMTIVKILLVDVLARIG